MEGRREQSERKERGIWERERLREMGVREGESEKGGKGEREKENLNIKPR